MTPSITIHQFPAVLGMQPSSFGLKLETWLRMCGQEHDVSTSVRDLGPKGKVPFANIDGEVMGDSELIIKHLSKSRRKCLEVDLDARQRAKGILIRRLVEEHLYFVLVYSRWVDPDGWRGFQPLFFGPAPALVRGFISKKIRKKVVASLAGQGIARHTPEQVYEKGRVDFLALSTLLGDRMHFLGEGPTQTDASAYGLLANLHYSPIQGPLQEMLKKHKNLIEFVERIKGEYWPNSELGGGDEEKFALA